MSYEFVGAVEGLAGGAAPAVLAIFNRRMRTVNKSAMDDSYHAVLLGV
jgi:hypothetical protein